MLPFAARICKAQIDIFHIIVFNKLENILSGLHFHASLISLLG